MKASERRDKVLGLLKKSRTAVTGKELAERFEVTRQVIVQDIALLRAGGEEIISTPAGYLYFLDDKEGVFIRRTFACQHGLDNVEEELLTFVELGGRVLDVSIEHPIYGELKGMLMLQNVEDVKQFMRQLDQANAGLLSALTNGVHLHTVEAINKTVLDRIGQELKRKGFLLSEE